MPFWVTELQGGNNTYSGYKAFCPTKEEITQWAKKNNLAIEFEYGHKDGAKAGYAIETKPKAGSTIPINTVIHVVIQK